MVEPLEEKKAEQLKGKYKIDFVYEADVGEYNCTANEGEHFVTFKYFPEDRKPKNLHSFDLSVFNANLIGVYVAETEYELQSSHPKIILTTDDTPTPQEIIEALGWGPCDDIFTISQ